MIGKNDPSLLEPGWAGNLAPEELSKKRRPEWAVRQVAEFGNPEVRSVNMQLARHQIPTNLEAKRPNHAQTLMDKTPGHVGGQGMGDGGGSCA